MTEPTLIENIYKDLKDAEEFKKLITSDEWLEHNVHELEGHFDTLIGRMNEASQALKEQEWVKIDDPRVEEWKDGRPVLIRVNRNGNVRVFVSEYKDLGFCKETGKDYGCGLGWVGVEEYIETITHAMLPPQPPKG